MSKFIEDIWNGTFNPQEHFGRNNQEIRRLEVVMRCQLEKLRNHLDDVEREEFEKYYSCINEYLLASTEQAFTDGFGVGVRLVAEGFVGTDSLL